MVLIRKVILVLPETVLELRLMLLLFVVVTVRRCLVNPVGSPCHDSIAIILRRILVPVELPFELVWVLCELLDAFSVKLDQCIELFLRQDSELAVAATDS